jgi:hypothetical protein
MKLFFGGLRCRCSLTLKSDARTWCHGMQGQEIPAQVRFPLGFLILPL